MKHKNYVYIKPYEEVEYHAGIDRQLWDIDRENNPHRIEKIKKSIGRSENETVIWIILVDSVFSWPLVAFEEFDKKFILNDFLNEELFEI